MIQYEWSIEERTNYDDGSYDVEIHDFADRLDQYGGSQWDEIDGKTYVLILHRRDWKSDYSNWTGEEAEAARGDDGLWHLPEKFGDIDGCKTVKVPKRFHAELAKRQSANSSKNSAS